MGKNDYVKIWNKVLSKYEISSFVYDIGDNLRKIHVYNLLNRVLKNFEKGHESLIISDFGAGNWLYLDKIYQSINKNSIEKKICLYGFDFSEAALKWGVEKYKNLKPKNVQVVLKPGDFMEMLNSKSCSISDLVLTLEVTEHIKDDANYLVNIFNMLKDGGFLIISVPNANPLFPSLDWFQYVFSRNKLIEKDLRVGHYRRYNTKDLQELLREIGYSIIKTQHYDFILSGYLELLLSRTFTRDNLFKRVLFRICLNIIMFEDFLFNLLRIRKSGGIFILAQKTK